MTARFRWFAWSAAALLFAVVSILTFGSVGAKAEDAVVYGDATRLTGIQAEYTAGDPIIVTAYAEGKYDTVTMTRDGDSASSYWKYITAGVGTASINSIGLGSGVPFDLMSQARNVDSTRTKLWPGKYIIRLMPTNAAGNGTSSSLDQAVAWAEINVKPDATQNYDPDALVQGENASFITLENNVVEVGDPINVTVNEASSDYALRLYVWRSSSMKVEYNLGEVGAGNTVDMTGGSMLPAGEYILRVGPSSNSGAHALATAWAKVTVKKPDPVYPATPTSVTYELTDPTDGFAAGIVTVTIPDYDPNTDYDVVMYWANEDGPLAGYSALQKKIVTGSTTTFAFQPGQVIPEGATKLYVYTMHTRSETLSHEPFIVTLPAGAAIVNDGTPVTEFQVVSDTHINRTSQADLNFKAMLKDIKANENGSIGLFIVGDVTHNGTEAEYRLIRSYYDEEGGLPPMFWSIGNHDVRNGAAIGGSNTIESVTATFCNYTYLPDGTHPSDSSYDFWLNGYHFVFLGTDVLTDPSCILSDDTLNWLDETLAENRDPMRPTFVFLHQSILNTVAGCLDYQWAVGAVNDPTASRLVQIYQKYPEVVLFNGHSHFELTSNYCMHVPTTELPINIFNTAAIAYLSTEYRVTSSFCENAEGSQGYYVTLYNDRMTVRARNFVTGEWMPSGYFELYFGDETRDAWTHLPKAEGHTHCICGADHKVIGINHAYENFETFAEVNASTGLPTPEAYKESFVYLTSDITLDETYILEKGQKLRICLNGHTIHGNAGIRMFYIPNPNDGAELFITDCSEAGTGTLDAHNTSETPLGEANACTATDGTAVSAVVGGQIIQCSSSGNSATKLKLYNVTLKNGWVAGTNGGGAVCSSAPNALFYNVKVTDCGAGTGTSGGAFQFNGSRSASFYNCKITNCSAGSYGGAMFPVNAGTSVILHDTEITDCTAGSGGGALFSNKGTIILFEGTVIKRCSAPKGGVAYVTSGKQSDVLYHGTFKMYGGLLGGSEEDRNEATNGQGGCLLIESGNFYMSGGEISYGTAGHGGNVVLQTGSTGEMLGGKILYGSTKNTSANLGGGNVGLYSSDTVFTMSGGEIAYGYSKGNGGNIIVRDGNTSFIMTGGIVREGVSANAAGGNIEVGSNDKNTDYGEVTITGTAVVAGGSFETAGTGYGGNIGFYVNRPVTISGNAKILNGTAMRGGNIGGNGNCQLTIADNAVIANGSSTQVGGNIYTGGNSGTPSAYIHMTGGTIQNGSTPQWGGNIVFFKIKEFVMTGGRILDGTSSTGGGNIGISPNNSAGEIPITIENGIIAGGNGGTGDGGNIRVLQNTSYINMEVGNGAVITGGTTTSWGGNILVNSCSTSGYINKLTIDGTAKFGTEITVEKTEYVYDSATGAVTETTSSKTYAGGSAKYGGNVAMYNAAAELAISGGTLAACTATESADCVYTNASTINVTGGTIDSIVTGGGTTNVTDGYVKSLSLKGTKAVSGGYFVERPDDSYLASGKAVLMGIFENVDPADETEYLYTVSDSSNGVYVDAYSEVSGLAGVSSTITGTGSYLAGAPFRLTASELAGFDFLGWFLGDEKVSEELTYVGESAFDAEYAAKFALNNGYVILTVRASAFTYAFDGGDAVEATTGITVPVARGTEVSLVYTDSVTLNAWMNESGKVLSNVEACSFPIYTSTFVETSVKDVDSDVTVIFMTDYNQIFATRYVIGGVLTDGMPNAPYRIGRTTSWNKTEDEILEEAMEAETVTVSLETVANPEVYTVTVKDGETAIFEKEATLGRTVYVSLPAENFLYVKLGDAILSYEPAFAIRGDQALELTAFYGTEAVTKESLVTMTIVKGTTGAISFSASRVVIAEDADVAEQGILFALTEVPEADFTKGAANVRAAVSTSKDKADVTALNLNTSAPKTVYARAYVVLTDGTEIYSDVVSATSL